MVSAGGGGGLEATRFGTAAQPGYPSLSLQLPLASQAAPAAVDVDPEDQMTAATLATLASLAASHQQQQQQQLYLGAAADHRAVKRSSNSVPHGCPSSKLQRSSGGSSPSGSCSPGSASDAVAAAASLHKLSSAAATDFDAAFALAHPPAQARTAADSAANSGRRGASGGRNTPQQIMAELVSRGVLAAASPETHCFVKCGNVSGVFSLASGSILCLCNECGTAGEPVWFPPSSWERHGGMAASKKWRGSIQVKGLASRRTLGQWLDDRGLTAKPRLTLADQVSQSQPPPAAARQRSQPPQTSRGGPAADLAAAAANAARLGVRQSMIDPGWTAASNTQQGGGSTSYPHTYTSLHRGSSGIDADVLDSYRPAAAVAAAAAAAAATASLDHSASLAASAITSHGQLQAFGADAAPAGPHDELIKALGLDKQLSAAAAASAAATAAPGGAAFVQPPPQQQQKQQQQQQQQSSAPRSPVLAADRRTNSLAALLQLLPQIAGSRAGDDGTGDSAAQVRQGIGPAQPQPPRAAAAASGSRTLAETLALATSSALHNPALTSSLLLEALQEQLQAQPANSRCQQAAVNAAGAVASAGASVAARRGKRTSASAAFAAIAAAAAAAAAASAAADAADEECQKQDELPAPAARAAAPVPAATATTAAAADAAGGSAADAVASLLRAVLGAPPASLPAPEPAAQPASSQPQQQQSQQQQSQQQQSQRLMDSVMLTALLQAAAAGSAM